MSKTVKKSETTAVLISWQRRDTVLENIGRLVDIGDGLAQIIVVDNGSTDGTSDIIREKFPTVKLITKRENTGIDAYNMGFARVKTKYTLILDDDSYPEATTLQRAADFLDDHREIGALAFRIVDTITRVPAKYWYIPETENTQECLAFVGCGALIRTDILGQMGGYCGDFFLYENEIDLCLRMKMAGSSTCFFPESLAYHPSSQRRGTTNMIYYGSRNKMLICLRFLPKWHGFSLIFQFFLTNIYLSFRFGHILLRWQAFFSALFSYGKSNYKALRPLNSQELGQLRPLFDELRLITWLKR